MPVCEYASTYELHQVENLLFCSSLFLDVVHIYILFHERTVPCPDQNRSPTRVFRQKPWYKFAAWCDYMAWLIRSDCCCGLVFAYKALYILNHARDVCGWPTHRSGQIPSTAWRRFHGPAEAQSACANGAVLSWNRVQKCYFFRYSGFSLPIWMSLSLLKYEYSKSTDQ